MLRLEMAWALLGRVASERLFVNMLALVGALVGLLNTTLAWKVFGSGATADVWMISVVIAQSMVLLSQLGVEQVAVYQAESDGRERRGGIRFEQSSLLWSILFGVAFSVLCALGGTVLIQLFAHGLDSAQQDRLHWTVIPLFCLVSIGPSQFLIRQQLLLAGRNKLATSYGVALPLIQTLCLLSMLGTGDHEPRTLAIRLSVLSVAFALVSFIPVRDNLGLRIDWASLRPFIVNSVKLRFTHSIHNLLVVAITNQALSTGAAGTVATFQYAKRIADGLATVSIGPHAAIYHARQARAWAARNLFQFKGNIKNYLVTSIPLLVLGILIALLVVAVVPAYLPMPPIKIWSYEGALVSLLLGWQLLIALETIPVGVIIMSKAPSRILVVNLVFVGTFVSALHVFAQPAATGVGVATISIGAQLFSTFLFSFLARQFLVARFQ